jgi:hypothetical protein
MARIPAQIKIPGSANKSYFTFRLILACARIRLKDNEQDDISTVA